MLLSHLFANLWLQVAQNIGREPGCSQRISTRYVVESLSYQLTMSDPRQPSALGILPRCDVDRDCSTPNHRPRPTAQTIRELCPGRASVIFRAVRPARPSINVQRWGPPVHG